jgi:peptidoglycan/xylan/chitin deacetylase (PgdA/CDA1 family)
MIAAIAALATVAACSPGGATLTHSEHLAAPPPTVSSPTTPSATPSATPTASPTPQPVVTRSTVAPPSGPISCNGGHITLNRSIAGGTGPFGSMISTGSTAVALTFDDGPDPVNTPQILDLLKECGVHATFCLVGHRARDNPALVKRIYNEGHTLCNHSWQHLDLSHPPATTSTGAPYSIVNDLQATNNAIHAAVPGAPIKYFRAPYGAWTQDVINAAKSLGMTPLDWSVDPRDWDSATYGTGASMVNHIIGAVEGAVHPGSIVLSHDNAHPDTITAYRTLLPWLKARFTLIALSTAQP